MRQGDVSKQNLARLAFGRNAIADCPRLDRYKRPICKVQVDGVDVGLAQIEAGLAWWYRQYAKEQSARDRAIYAQAEEAARAAPSWTVARWPVRSALGIPAPGCPPRWVSIVHSMEFIDTRRIPAPHSCLPEMTKSLQLPPRRPSGIW